jgi:hypothetical protein
MKQEITTDEPCTASSEQNQKAATSKGSNTSNT